MFPRQARMLTALPAVLAVLSGCSPWQSGFEPFEPPPPAKRAMAAVSMRQGPIVQELSASPGVLMGLQAVPGVPFDIRWTNRGGRSRVTVRMEPTAHYRRATVLTFETADQCSTTEGVRISGAVAYQTWKVTVGLEALSSTVAASCPIPGELSDSGGGGWVVQSVQEMVNREPPLAKVERLVGGH